MKDFNNKDDMLKSHGFPTWREIVAMERGKGLRFTDEYQVVDVIYSKDGEHRFVILKSSAGYLTYKYEYLVLDAEDEWEYYPKDALPAYWYSSDWSYDERTTTSLFGDVDDLMRDLKAQPQYKTYFE